jgi:predicted Fe-Mo cluster-binding NifX family protein
MRIAVTATGNDLNSAIDPRFGRARYIIIVDDAGSVLEVVDNSAGMNTMGGAGIQAGKLMADRKVDVLLTGNCGPNAYKALNAANIKVAINQSGTVQEAIDRLKKGEVSYASSPNVDGHW